MIYKYTKFKISQKVPILFSKQLCTEQLLSTTTSTIHPTPRPYTLPFGLTKWPTSIVLLYAVETVQGEVGYRKSDFLNIVLDFTPLI